MPAAQIPTGPLPPISPSSGLDFRSSGGEKGALIGEKLALKKEMEGLCGSGCSGIDNALIFSSSSSPSASSKYRNDSSSPVLILSSPEGSGIRMTLRTNQPAVHLYTCNGFSSSSSTKPSSPSDSSTRYKRKASHLHQHPEEGEEEEQLYYPHQSCLAIEPEGLIDAVHHWREEDEWGYDPFYTPEREYEWWTEYAFDVV